MSNSLLLDEENTQLGSSNLNCTNEGEMHHGSLICVDFCFKMEVTRRVIFTYLLTPWSTVLLEKLTFSQPVKKFPAFYATQMFIIAFTSARHLSLS